MEILKGVVLSDYVYIFVFVLLKLVISDLMCWIKGWFVFKFFWEFYRLKKCYWGCYFWGCGYFLIINGVIIEDIVF